ncbi:MAG TPA: CAP domain-containing protein [Tepidisphaeraceae bacterium]|jgi:hypothetical protein|nr:CAP domain-containing protein [Tepidisphaeraceae bacterium]
MHCARLVVLACLFAFAFPVHPAFSDEPKKPETRKTEEKELYNDGSIHFRVPLDSKGQRHGQYTAWYPGGKKKVQERVRYEHGQRVGDRALYAEDGTLIGDETWVHGKLVLPKSQRMIEAERARLLKAAAAFVVRMGKPTNPNAPTSEELARALAKLNGYRYLCDLQADVVLDDEEINLCQYASEVLAKLGHLTHTPEKPSGYDDKAYQLGRDGCGHSNIFQGGDAIASVSAYMNDSDASNIDRLGHRRWILHPSMAKTGFGMSGQFSAMYSFDGSRQNTPDYEYVCFPPRGWCPMNMFGPNWAWSVSVNPAKYKVTDGAKLEIFPVDSSLARAARPLASEYAHLDRGGYGVNNAIIGRPPATAVRPGVVYEVVVRGVNTQDDMPADISYYVSFYNAPASAGP